MNEITSQNVLSLTGPGYGLTLKREAIELKESLLKLSAPIVSIQNEIELTVARATLKDLASFRVQLEKSRKAVKEPVIDLGRKIDDAAEKFGLECIAEEKRITKLGQEYAAEVERQRREKAEVERRVAEAAARAAAEEARRAEAEAVAERARIIAETCADETAQADLFRKAQAAEAERIGAQQAAERAQAAATAAAQATTFTSPAVAGTKIQLDYEIENLELLYFATPELVELTPRRREILATIDRLFAAGKPVKITGLKIVEKIKLK